MPIARSGRTIGPRWAFTSPTTTSAVFILADRWRQREEREGATDNASDGSGPFAVKRGQCGTTDESSSPGRATKALMGRTNRFWQNLHFQNARIRSNNCFRRAGKSLTKVAFCPPLAALSETANRDIPAIFCELVGFNSLKLASGAATALATGNSGTHLLRC